MTGRAVLLVGRVLGATCNPSLCSSQCRMMGGGVRVAFSEVECRATLWLAADEDDGGWETVDNKTTSCVVDSNIRLHCSYIMSHD